MVSNSSNTPSRLQDYIQYCFIGAIFSIGELKVVFN